VPGRDLAGSSRVRPGGRGFARSFRAVGGADRLSSSRRMPPGGGGPAGPPCPWPPAARGDPAAPGTSMAGGPVRPRH